MRVVRREINVSPGVDLIRLERIGGYHGHVTAADVMRGGK